MGHDTATGRSCADYCIRRLASFKPSRHGIYCTLGVSVHPAANLNLQMEDNAAAATLSNPIWSTVGDPDTTRDFPIIAA